MKYLIVGYNCSGKTFSSDKLSAAKKIPVLHIDDVYYDHSTKPVTERDYADVKNDVISFMESNENWALDGGYDKTGLYECCRAADRIIFMRINRFSRLVNLCRRCRAKYPPKTAAKRFFRSLPWLLFLGCGKKYDAENYASLACFPEKVTVFKTLSRAQKYMDTLS